MRTAPAISIARLEDIAEACNAEARASTDERSYEDPWIWGECSLIGMTDEQWKQVGTIFQRIHQIMLPLVGFASLRKAPGQRGFRVLPRR